MLDELKLITYGHPVLRKNALPIKKFTPLIADVASKMFEIMSSKKGLGLAAPQVGLPWQIFILNINKPLVFINPVLSWDRNPRFRIDNEGCLSLPGIYLDISRPHEVYVEAFDVDGKPFKAKYAGMHARCIQHEYDHLNGMLIIDRDVIKTAPLVMQLPSTHISEEDRELMQKWENHDVLGI